jgi:protein TonB
LSTILTTSGALHLLVIGYLGFGIPADTPRPHVVHAAPPPPPIIENVQLEAPPPPKAQKLELKEDEPTPLPDAPAPVAAIAAVPANVSVAFAVKVEGPVHLVSDASLASGAFAPPPPVIPKEASERNLLTPDLAYPAEALHRRYTGQVVIEFHTTAQGDIIGARIRSSSGHALLDQAALDNLRLGRWVGEAGYFVKTYEFVLR